ncbi:MAG: CAP domain-containing protein [Planctomycetota bacterium]|jgi:uncharacterized protein YkwD
MKHFHKLHLILLLGLLSLALACLSTGCSKKHKSDRDSAATTYTGTGGTTGGGTTGGGNIGQPSQADIQAVFDAVNKECDTQGLPRLQYDNSIAAVAQKYADYCASLAPSNPTKVTYYSPSHDDKSPEQRLQEGGIAFTVCEEGGLVGQDENPDPDMVVHYFKNRLDNGNFTRCGIGMSVYQATWDKT